MYFDKDFIERNLAEPKNWKKPFDSDIFNSVFRSIGVIFNYISSKFLIVATVTVVVFIIGKQWLPAIILIIVLIPIYIIRFAIRWITKNHKKIKTSKTSEGVIIVEIEKEVENENVKDDININQSTLPFK